MTDKEQVISLRNRHVARLLDRINEVTELPELIQLAIKKEFSYFAEDVNNQVISKNKENTDEPKQLQP